MLYTDGNTLEKVVLDLSIAMPLSWTQAQKNYAQPVPMQCDISKCTTGIEATYIWPSVPSTLDRATAPSH